MAKAKVVEEKEISVFAAGNNALRSIIIDGSAMLCGGLQMGVKVTQIGNTTLDYARASNAAWAAEGMSGFDDSTRAFIKMVDPTMKIPPQLGADGKVLPAPGDDKTESS